MEETELAVSHLQRGLDDTTQVRSTARVQRLRTVSLNAIEPEETSWLWSPYYPLGEMTLIQGNPGVGKSQLFPRPRHESSNRLANAATQRQTTARKRSALTW